MTTEATKALVKSLEAEMLADGYIAESSPEFKALCAIFKPMADERTSVLLNDIRTIADMGGRRGETAMDACDKIVELIDMERQLGPAARA